MAVRRGKRRRKERRRVWTDGERPIAPQPQPAATRPEPRRRGGRPLAQRSPIVSGAFCLLCVVGTVFTATTFPLNGRHLLNVFFLCLYAVLAIVQGWLTFAIRRARGSWS